jgi:hypothetical protein
MAHHLSGFGSKPDDTHRSRSAGLMMPHMTRFERILRGLSCVHPRMRAVSCGECSRPCRIECPDCGLTWMFEDDDR